MRARAGSASISRKQLEAEEATRPSSLNKTKTAPAQQPEAKPNPDDQKSSGRKSILDTISEDRKAFMEKDAAVQKSIASREEKIQQLKEKSLKKEDDLSAKTLELMELRERTRRMMEKARAKEVEFKENEKKLESVLTTFHPDGNEYYNIASSLLEVCKKFENPKVSLNDEIQLFHPIRPMLAGKKKI